MNPVPEILFITSYPPRECGIATYSQDLVHALNQQFENSFRCSICALETDSEQPVYPQQPAYTFNTNSSDDYLKTASFINANKNVMLVVFQHEFGFFAEKEKEFHQLIHHISKPIVFVFHTVLPHPNNTFKSRVQDMAEVASAIVVMTDNSAQILQREYHVSQQKITVIPHGTHLVPQLNREKLKEQYGLSNRLVLSTFGLLSSSKSIETSLDALPEVIKKFPEVLFLVLGITHPNIVKQEGEHYRTLLENKVKELNLSNHVKFVNSYLELPILLEYLQLTDIYLFTSKDPNQAVSGTFSYAISCGCPIISTPIPHAKEVITHENGILIDFGNSEQLTASIINLLDNEKLRSTLSLNSLQKMAYTAWQNSALAHALLFKKVADRTFELRHKLPGLNLHHIQIMTTDFGMIQFSKIAQPDIHSGYTLDDNARALIAMCQHYKLYRQSETLKKINTYLNFIKHCQQTSGVFLNYVNEEKEYTLQNYAEHLDDCNGRAIWALGYVASLEGILPQNLIIEAKNLLELALPQLENIYSTRAMAFIIKGLHYLNANEHQHLIALFANRLSHMYRHEKADDWHWFEDTLTYGNSIIPEAMLCAYISTNDHSYKGIAKESFTFLLSKIMVDGKIKVISNKGWYQKNSTDDVPVGGEQPIDVAYTIVALEKFYAVFKEAKYKTDAVSAFNWFLGSNHLNQIVYNPCTGGCYDGVEEFNVNLNQGAESTLSYLLARLAMERIRQSKESSRNHKHSISLATNY